MFRFFCTVTNFTVYNNNGTLLVIDHKHNFDSKKIFGSQNDTMLQLTLNGFDFNYDNLIIQMWWPDPELKYEKSKITIGNINLNPKHIKHYQNSIIERMLKVCKVINQQFRNTKYLNNSKLFYIGDINWLMKNIPQCFKYDQIYTRDTYTLQ